jgi:hypothetical protein
VSRSAVSASSWSWSKAGTGKTFALGAAKEAWEAAGHTVVGAAVARRAANELAEGAGMTATSVAALLFQLDGGACLPPKTVVVVDEAGMLATRPMARLLEHIDRAEGKLVLVGDHRQLPELGAGGAFRGLAVRTQAAYLVENRRQREAWERDALEALRQGRAGDALDHYKEHGRLVVGKDAERLRQQLVRDWWLAGQRQPAVMIALRREDVRDLNGRARLLMRTAGRLGTSSIALRGGDFSPGDAIVTKLNHLRAGVVNGERGTVVAVDAVRGSVEVDLSGRRVVLGLDYVTAETQIGGASLLHGYAITGARGARHDHRARVCARLGRLISRVGYAALSRGSAANHLYVVPDQAERNEFAPQDRRTRDPLPRFTAPSRARGRSRWRPMSGHPSRTQTGVPGTPATWTRSRVSETPRKPNSGKRGQRRRPRGRSGGPAASTALAAPRRRRSRGASQRCAPRNGACEAISVPSTELCRQHANARWEAPTSPATGS